MWVVGSGGTILHFSGRGPGWTVSLPAGTMRCHYELNGIWAASDTDVFAAGTNGDIFRFNGTSWAKMTTPAAGNCGGVMGLSANNVYATCDRGVWRWNGSTWSVMSPAPASRDWYDIWVNSDSEIYLAGGVHSLSIWNGTSWTNTSVPAASTNWSKGVWASAPNDIFYQSWTGTYHYNGSSWTLIADGGMQFPSMPFAGGSGADLWQLGSETGMRHWNGVAMEAISTGVSQPFNGIFRTRGGEYFAVGDFGAAAWFDGLAWSPMITNTSMKLRSVHGASRNRFWAIAATDVAADCAILQFDGDLPRLPCGADTGAARSAVDPATGNCLLAFAQPRPWADAEAHCVTLGGHLVTLETRGKNEIAGSLRHGNDWIGLNDQATEGAYVWASGSGATYRNWDGGQPDNHLGGEDCVHFYTGDVWNDNSCTSSLPYLCEIP